MKYSLLIGEHLDSAAVTRYRNALTAQFPEIRTKKLTEISIDMSQCMSINSSGMGFLIYLKANCEKFKIKDLSKEVSSYLKKAGLYNCIL